jgi:hypothetical protein
MLSVEEAPQEYVEKMRVLVSSSFFSSNPASTSMFVPKVVKFSKYPCSLVFEDLVDQRVSTEAIDILERLSGILGPLGSKEGYYGAGGGALHLFYFGRRGDAAEAAPYPSLAELLDSVMKVAAPMRSPEFPWYSSVDVCHQQLFPRTARESASPPEDLLRRIYTVLSEARTVQPCPFPLPRMCAEQFPYISEPLVLFVAPYCEMFHDGTCASVGCNRDSSMIAETTGGAPTDPGDLYESPSFAVFCLCTGEVFALSSWDYHG